MRCPWRARDEAAHRFRRAVRNRLAVDTNCSGVRVERSLHRSQDGRLTRAVGTDEADERPAVDAEIDARDDRLVAEGDREVRHVKHRPGAVPFWVRTFGRGLLAHSSCTSRVRSSQEKRRAEDGGDDADRDLGATRAC